MPPLLSAKKKKKEEKRGANIHSPIISSGPAPLRLAPMLCGKEKGKCQPSYAKQSSASRDRSADEEGDIIFPVERLFIRSHLHFDQGIHPVRGWRMSHAERKRSFQSWRNAILADCFPSSDTLERRCSIKKRMEKNPSPVQLVTQTLTRRQKFDYQPVDFFFFSSSPLLVLILSWTSMQRPLYSPGRFGRGYREVAQV